MRECITRLSTTRLRSLFQAVTSAVTKEKGPAEESRRARSNNQQIAKSSDSRAQYIPPMPPPPGIAGASFFSSGISATIASVVSRSDAIDEAFCSALRTTLAGSMTPALTRSS